jgi:hypothetical protein
MKKIVIPIYYHNDETLKSEACGMDYNIEKCNIKNMIIYKLNGMSEYTENNKIVGTNIYFNGDKFVSPLKINEIEELINCSENNTVIYKELYTKNNKGEFISVT